MGFIINLMSAILMTFARVMSVVIATWIVCFLAILLFLALSYSGAIDGLLSITGISISYFIPFKESNPLVWVLAFIGIVLLWFFVIKPLWKLELWSNIEENLKENFKALSGLTAQVAKNTDVSSAIKKTVISSAINTANVVEEIKDGVKYKKQKVTAEIENEWYAIALSEIENEDYEKGLWSKALMSSDGDGHKQKAVYIKLRVEQLGASYNSDFDN
jgi:hypothetical protein